MLHFTSIKHLISYYNEHTQRPTHHSLNLFFPRSYTLISFPNMHLRNQPST